MNVKAGDKIRTKYQRIYTVLRVVGNVAYVDDSLQYSVNIHNIVEVL
jgi:hypothetical protein